MPTRLSLWCDRLMEAGWLAAVLLVPLFFQTTTARIFEPDKMVLVRVIALMMAVAWVVRVIDIRLARGESASPYADDEPGFWRRVAPLMWPTLVIVAATVLATGASIALRPSLLGAYQRGQGLVSVVAFLVIFLLTLAYLRRRDQVDRLVTVIILASVPVALFGILQWVGPGPGVFSGLYAGRAFSSLGNPIFLGGYLIMVLPLTLVRALRPAAGALRALYAILVVLQLITLGITFSLGAWVGFAVAAGVFALAAVALRGRRGAILAVAIAAPLVVGGLVLALNTPAVRTGLGDSPVAVRRISRLFDAGDRSTLRVRLLLWDAAARTMGVDPVRLPFGYGPETNIITLSANVSPALRYLGDADKNPDRSHNEIWDRLIETGALGLVGYLWLVIAAFYLIVRRLGLVASRDRLWTFVGLTIGGAAAGGLIPVLAGLALYLGIGTAVGLLLGLWIFLASAAFGRSGDADLTPEGRWLLIALLAALAGHFIEVNIGPADPTRRLMFWALVALAGALSARPALLSARATVSYRPTPALAYGGVAGLMLATLVYTFIPLDGFALAANNYGIVWFMLLTFLVGGSLLWAEAVREATVASAAAPSWLPVLGMAVAGFLVMLALRAAVLLGGGDSLSLLWVYLLALGVSLALIATWLPTAAAPAGRTRPLALAAYVPLALVALATAAIGIVAPMQADMVVRTAQAYLAAGDPTTALRLASRAVADQPGEPVYAQQLGEMLASVAPLAASAQDRDALYGQAIEAFGLAAQQWPTYGDYQYNIGHTYLLWAQQAQDQNQRQQMLAAAFQSLQGAALLDPNEPDNFVEAAQAAILANQAPANTQTLLLQALTLDPRNVQAYVLLGRLYLSQGQGAAAEKALQNAAQLNPKGAEAAAVYSALGDFYQRSNRLPEAIDSVQKVVDLAPDNFAGYLNLAGLYQRANRLPEALKTAQKALELAPAESRQRVLDLISQIQQGTRPSP